MIRPGPPALPAGVFPGGVVFHVYSVPSCVLLLTQNVAVTDDVEAAATHAAEQCGMTQTDEWPTWEGGGVCLVAFDGDTGKRYSAEEWTALL